MVQLISQLFHSGYEVGLSSFQSCFISVLIASTGIDNCTHSFISDSRLLPCISSFYSWSVCHVEHSAMATGQISFRPLATQCFQTRSVNPNIFNCGLEFCGYTTLEYSNHTSASSLSALFPGLLSPMLKILVFL